MKLGLFIFAILVFALHWFIGAYTITLGIALSIQIFLAINQYINRFRIQVFLQSQYKKYLGVQTVPQISKSLRVGFIVGELTMNTILLTMIATTPLPFNPIWLVALVLAISTFKLYTCNVIVERIHKRLSS